MPKATKKISKKAEAPTLVKISPIQKIKSKLTKTQWYSVLGVVALGLIVYFGRGLVVVATVNGQPITRLEVIKNLEQQYGAQTVSSLVTKTLILQEAKNQKVEVTSAEIDAEIKKIEASVTTQGQKLDDLLKTQNMTRESLKEQIKIEKLIQKLVGKDTVITDVQVMEYYTANIATFPPGSNVEDLKPAIKQQLEQKILSDKFQSWIESLRQKAKINYIVNY